MISEKRSRVKEWRLSSTFGAMIVRYWIESDSAYGGVTLDDAERIVGSAEIFVRGNYPRMSVEEIAEHLLESILCANSVEVCNAFGKGVAVHRDWP